MNATEQDVWETVEALNRTWTVGPIEALRDFLHDEVVALTPMDRFLLVGREECFKSWERFTNACKIREFKPTDPRVKVFGDAAVVTYYYEITFQAQGTVHVEKGRDMFFMVRKEGRWLAVADQFSPFPKA